MFLWIESPHLLPRGFYCEIFTGHVVDAAAARLSEYVESQLSVVEIKKLQQLRCLCEHCTHECLESGQRSSVEGDILENKIVWMEFFCVFVFKMEGKISVKKYLCLYRQDVKPLNVTQCSFKGWCSRQRGSTFICMFSHLGLINWCQNSFCDCVER